MPSLDDATNSRDPFVRASAKAQQAIILATETRESARATRLRVKLRGLIAALRSTLPQSPEDVGQRLGEILQVVMHETAAPMGNIQLRDARGTLRIRVQSGCSSAFLDYFKAVEGNSTACARAFTESNPVVVEDVRCSDLYSPTARKVMLAAGAAAVQSVPLLKARTKLGVLSVHYPEAGIPRPRQEAFASLAAEISEAVALCLRD